MAGYQPRHDTDPVWYNGTQVNTLTYTSAQAGVMITAIHGWDERPDVRDVREDRAGDDGEWADNLFLGGRTITIEGEVMGSSWVNLQSRKRSLAAIFNPTSDEVLFKVPDPATVSPTTSYSESGMSGYERVYARVIEPIGFGDTLDPACQRWQVVLRASDPRVYSDEVTTTSSGTSGTAARTVTVDQTGTYPTPVDITVTGPTGSEYTVANSSSDLSLTMSGLTLASGDSTAFGVRDRTAQLSAGYITSRLVGSPAPVGLWMLDESAGTTADNEEGTSARDGTYTGGYTLNQTGPFVGISSVELNGSTGYVSIPDVSALYPSPSAAFEGWVYFDTVSTDQVIVDGKTSNKGFQIYLSGSTGRLVLSVGVSTSSSVITTSGTSLSTGTWYRVTAQIHSSFASIEAHTTSDVRQLSGSGSYGGGAIYTAATSGGYRFGSLLSGSFYLDGRIAAFAIYGSSLMYPVDRYPAGSTITSDVYQYLVSASARWAPLGTGSTTYTLSSSGLNTGSQLSVAYRNARL